MVTETPQKPRNQLVIAPYGVDIWGNPHGPNPTQSRVLEWIDNVRAKQAHQDGVEFTEQGTGIPILYLQGGVGSGKTRAILAGVDELLFEIPNLRALWGRQDFNDLRVSAMETFFEVMPPKMIVDKNVQEHRYRIGQEGGTTSQIFFKDLKDLSGLGSQEFGAIVITEVHETTLQAFRVLKMRCRQMNVPVMILMEGNPPNEGHWLSQVTDPNHEEYDPDIEMWEISTYENWENLQPVYRNSLEKMPASWRKKFLFGKFGFMPDGKPFYHGFVEDLHVGKFDWNEHRELLIGWDFGYHHPAVVISQIDDWDRWVILREIMGTDITIDQFSEKVIQTVNEFYPKARCMHLGDPACTQVNDKSERTSWAILRDKNILIHYRASDYRLRKEIIEQKLSRIVNKKPSLLVDQSCRTVIDGFLGGYHYPTRKEAQQFVQKLEMPFKDGWYEHCMNALEYIAVNLFSPLKPRRRPRYMPKKRGCVDNI